MQNALASLPGVEKDSIQVNISQKLASFKVKDPANFDINKAIASIEKAGNFKAKVRTVGTAIKPPSDQPVMTEPGKGPPQAPKAPSKDKPADSEEPPAKGGGSKEKPDKDVPGKNDQ